MKMHRNTIAVKQGAISDLHKENETTRYVYLHVTKSQKKEASQKFAELMRSL